MSTIFLALAGFGVVEVCVAAWQELQRGRKMPTLMAPYCQRQLRVAEADVLRRRGSVVSLHSGSPGRWSPLEALTRSRPLVL
jgi:hypothetical protein